MAPDRALQHLAFRLAARASAVILDNLVAEELCFPFTLLSLDTSSDAEALADQILASPRCVMDSWTLSMVSRYHDVPSLLSHEARLERQTLLLSFKQCTTRVEGRHASIRRLVKMSSLQSKSCDLPLLSAMSLLTFSKRDTGDEPGEMKDVTKTGKHRTKKRSRLVSPWNCFVHDKLKGGLRDKEGFSIETKHLGQLWQALTPEARLPYERWARCANQRRGKDLPAFRSGSASSVPVEAQRLADNYLDPLALANTVVGKFTLSQQLSHQARVVKRAVRILNAEKRRVRLEGEEERKRFHDQAQEEEVTDTKATPQTPSAHKISALNHESDLSLREFSNFCLTLPETASEVLGLPVCRLVAEDGLIRCALRSTTVARDCPQALAATSSAADHLRNRLVLHWEQSHKPIKHDEQPLLGKVASVHGRCWTFGRCICSADGKKALKLQHSFRSAFARLFAWAEHIRQQAYDAELVAEVRVEEPPPHGLRSLWLHLSYIHKGVLPRVTSWQLECASQKEQQKVLRPLLTAADRPLIVTLLDVSFFLWKDYDMNKARVSICLHELVNSSFPVALAQPSSVLVRPCEAPVAYVWPVTAVNEIPSSIAPSAHASASAESAEKHESSDSHSESDIEKAILADVSLEEAQLPADKPDAVLGDHGMDTLHIGTPFLTKPSKSF